MRLRSLRIVAAASVLLLGVPGLAAAQDGSLVETDIALNTLWVVLGGVLVLFMQAGFLLLETGLSRMKNAGAVAGKIIMNLAIAFLMFWATGFALGFGEGNNFLGSAGWFLDLGGIDYGAGGGTEAFFFFQAVFAAVSLAIVYGTMLDRTKFAAYIVFGIVYIGVIYPIVAHWTWGGGWLAQDGFLDFAGSSIVHLQGALAALTGTLVLGDRKSVV